MGKTRTVNLDHERELRLTLNDLTSLDNQIRIDTAPTSKGLVECISAIANGDFQFGALRTAYWYALRHTGRNVTPNTVGVMLEAAIEREGFAYVAMEYLYLLQDMGVLKVGTGEEDPGETADQGDDDHPFKQVASSG